jgi:hypothetical protein
MYCLSRALWLARNIQRRRLVAIIFTQTMPDGVPLELLDAVAEEMGVNADPPAGLIVHTHYEEDGRVHIVDVWESAESHQKFIEERLGPAMAKVAAQRGIDIAQAGQSESSVTEAHYVVRGR